MRWQAKLAWAALAAGWWLAPPAAAQTTSVPATSMSPTTITQSPLAGTVVGGGAEASGGYVESSVAFIDSSVPRSMMRLRYDLDWRNRTPSRAEYLFAKGGTPGSPGFAAPETGVDMQELFVHMELAFTPKFSFFAETPWRFLNPEMNPNTSGWGDMNCGAKWVLLCDEAMLATFQLRGYIPTGQERGSGTHHVSLEPGLLGNVRLTEYLTLEGEFRYWVPIGGTEFAGDVLRYGLGLLYGMSGGDEIWITPVAEVVGWTVLNGLSSTAYGPAAVATDEAAGTILTGSLGLRVGLGDRTDFYAGYSRAFTGSAWFRDQARFEFRVTF